MNHTSDRIATIVISMYFISLQLSIHHPSCRRVCGGGRLLSKNLADGAGAFLEGFHRATHLL